MLYPRPIRWIISHRTELLAVGLGIGLLPFFILCLYIQPCLDDFTTSTVALTYGVWKAQSYIFQHWSGRYFTNCLLFVANPLSYRWLAGVQLTAFISQLLRIGVLYFAVRTLTGTHLRRREAGLLAAGLALLYMALVPSKFSALYFFTDFIVYQIPAWLLVLVPLAVERWHRASGLTGRAAWGVAAVTGTVAAAGSNELTVILLGWMMLVAAGLSAYRRQRHSLRVWAGLGMLLLVCGAIMLLASGNTSRQELDSGLAPVTSAWEAASRLVVLLRYLFVEPAFLVVPALTLVLGPLAVRVMPARPPGLHLPLLLSVAVLIGGIVLGTIPYALMWARVPLLARATNALVWWWLLGWIVAAWASLPPVPSAVPVASPATRLLLGLVLLVVLLLSSARVYLDLLYDAPEFARQWQYRFEALRQASRTPHIPLEVPPLPPLTNRLTFMPPDDLSTVYGFGANTRLATWFGVDSVRVVVPR